jgi:hypothetical protein
MVKKINKDKKNVTKKKKMIKPKKNDASPNKCNLSLAITLRERNRSKIEIDKNRVSI